MPATESVTACQHTRSCKALISVSQGSPVDACRVLQEQVVAQDCSSAGQADYTPIRSSLVGLCSAISHIEQRGTSSYHV